MPVFNENLARMFQLRNMFGPEQPIGNDLPSQGGIMGNMNPDSFQPQTQAQDQFRQTIDQMPVRNKPGVWRQILANIGGAGLNQRTIDSINYAPYYRQMEDWQAKAEPLGRLATMEDRDNTLNRQVYTQNQNESFRRDRESRVAEDADARLQQADERTQLATKKFELQQELANGGRVIADRDGNMFVHTKKGEIKDIDKTALSFADKMKLQNEGRMVVVNDQQEAARELAKYRAELDAENAKLRGDIQKDVNAAKVSDPSQMSPNEVKTDQYVKAQRWFNTHPNAKKYMNLGDPGANTFTMTEPTGSWLRSASPEEVAEYKAATDAIYGAANGAVVTPPKVKPQLPTIQAAPVPGVSTKPPVNQGKTPIAKGVPVTKGVPPPREQRVVGQVHTFDNGVRVRWDGTNWIGIE